MKEGTLPHQTTALRQLAWSLVKDGEHQQTLDILDYPGEVYRLAFLNAEDENDPDEFRARVQAHQEEIKGLLGHLIQSEHIFVLFNLSDAKDLGSNAKNLDVVWVTNACLDYLHRLPHKPRVTLLLTQIDKYVDLEQYEFDPKVYVSHYLPLLANNFPNLDVCAVAALGVADSTYGIDSILLRSLFNAPEVQIVLDEIKDERKEWQNLLRGTFSKQHFRRLFAATQQMACDSEFWKERLPWFIKPELLGCSAGLLSIDVATEILTHMRDTYINCNLGQDEIDLENVLSCIDSIECQHSEVEDFFRTIRDSLQKQINIVNQQVKFEEAKKRRENVAEICCFFSGVIFVASIAFIISICIISIWTDINFYLVLMLMYLSFGVGVYVFDVLWSFFEMVKEKINAKK